MDMILLDELAEIDEMVTVALGGSLTSTTCPMFVPPNLFIKLRFWTQAVYSSDCRDLILISAKLAQGTTNAEKITADLNISLLCAQHFMPAL